MGTMIYLFGKIVWLYIFNPQIVRAIKVPPVTPLIPYLPQVFKLDFLPDFYFIYWIIILAVIAVTHEFAHGIFAGRNKVKVKTTGFGFFPFFLPIFLAAFVELDEKVMVKKSKFSQMAILSAGTFANVLTAILFFAVMWGFFSLAFTPSGVTFDTYVYTNVEITNITSVNGILINNPTYENILDLVNETGFTEIKTQDDEYLMTKELLELQEGNEEILFLYDDAPAIKAGLAGAITEINQEEIESIEDLSEELSKYSPGEEIEIKTKTDEESFEYTIVLEEHPTEEDSVWLGIGFIDRQGSGIIGRVTYFLSSFKQPHIYYEAKFDGFSIFIYNLLWWTILISISVALVNMLPIGIFDGGRFFYLTVLGITGSEKIAKKTFSYLTYFFIFLVFLLIFFWGLSFFS